MLTCGVALAVAALVAFLVTPGARHLAQRLDILDRPDRRRKLHRRLVPLWGGVAIFLALVAGMAAALVCTPEGRDLYFYHQKWFGGRLGWVFAAACLLAALGLVDDKVHIPPKVKLFIQLAASFCVVGAGFKVETFTWPFSSQTIHLWPWVGAGVSILWLTFVTNAFNFVDGLDGLASGMAVIAGVGLMVGAGFLASDPVSLFSQFQGRLAACLAAATAGSALGFWYYNKPPARIFLGDAGASLLGFFLALAALLAVGRAHTPWAVLVPLFILGWPLADAVLAVIRRWRRGDPISKADHRHLHHWLLEIGLSPRGAVVLILIQSGILTLLGVLAARL